MIFSKCLMTAVLVGVGLTGTACTDKAPGETTKDAALRTADKTKVMAGEAVEKGKEVATAAGAAMTDGWITTKVKAKFADEIVLKGSDISVDTAAHVVTLKGAVPSDAARTRAMVIAHGTDGVTGVVDRLVVR